jgi:hypothetical protein
LADPPRSQLAARVSVMMRQPTVRSVFPYLIAVASLVLAFGLRVVVDPALGNIQPLTTFYIAIAITALVRRVLACDRRHRCRVHRGRLVLHRAAA